MFILLCLFLYIICILYFWLPTSFVLWHVKKKQKTIIIFVSINFCISLTFYFLFQFPWFYIVCVCVHVITLHYSTSFLSLLIVLYYLFFSFFLLNIVLLFPWFYWLDCVVMITLPSICMGNDKTSTPLLLVVISPYVVGQDQQQPINIIPGDSCCHRICISPYHPWIFLANFANFNLLKF